MVSAVAPGPPPASDCPSRGPVTASSHPPPSVAAAGRQPTNEPSARAASVSARPGSSQAAAPGNPATGGSSAPPAVSSGTHTARTAAVRVSSSRSPPDGVAAVISYSGSACRPYETATPASGSAGRRRAAGSVPPGPPLRRRVRRPRRRPGARPPPRNRAARARRPTRAAPPAERAFGRGRAFGGCGGCGGRPVSEGGQEGGADLRQYGSRSAGADGGRDAGRAGSAGLDVLLQGPGVRLGRRALRVPEREGVADVPGMSRGSDGREGPDDREGRGAVMRCLPRGAGPRGGPPRERRAALGGRAGRGS